jgi:hypothetical protein
MEDFIDEKSARAKGKRVSTLDIASIEDVTPAPVIEEPEPEVEDEVSPLSGETLDGMGSEEPEKIEVEGVTMTFEKPKDTQLDLF